MIEATSRDVVKAGLFGGALFWCVRVIAGGLPVGEQAVFGYRGWLVVSLVLSAVVGAGAAYLGVNWLANTDVRRRQQCLGFAVACGFMWEPVLTSVSERVTKTFQDRRTAEAVQQGQQLTMRPVATVETRRAADLAIHLATAAPQLQSPTLQGESWATAQELVKVIGKRAESEPGAARDLERVTEQAAAANDSAVSNSSLRELERVAASAPAPASQEAARQAIARIHANLPMVAAVRRVE